LGANAIVQYARARRLTEAREDAEWERLIETAKRIDPDPVRNEERDAIRTDDAAALVRLAAREDPANLDPQTVSGIGWSLYLIDKTEMSIDWLRRGRDAHPGSWHTNVLLGLATGGHEAVGALTAAVALEPDSAPVRVLLGFKIYMLGKDRVDDAIAVWNDALRLDPSYGFAKAWIADALWRVRDDQTGARAAWDDAIRLSPQDHKIYINRARALSVADPAQAIRDYRTALGIVDISYTRYSLALLLANASDESVRDPEGAFREAEAALRSARKYKTESVEQKCYMLLEWLDPARAIETYEGELRDRESATLRYRLAHVLAYTSDKSVQDPKRAFREAETALRLAHEYKSHRVEQECYVLLERTDPARAIKKYEGELRDRESATLRYRLAYVLAFALDVTLRDWPRALREFDAVIRLCEQSGDKELECRSYQMRAYLLTPTDPARAIEDFKQAIRLRESAHVARFNLVNLLANAPDKKLRDPEAAVRQAKLGLRLARKAGPKATESKMRLALAYAQYRAGEYADALAGFKSAQDLEIGNPIILASFRAMTHWQLGEKEKARRWLAEANEKTIAGTVDSLGFIAARLEEAQALVK
jgi:Flp pilus assembly protein TadD